MANKAISELPQALNVNNQDLFVLEQSGIAKKLTAETFITEQGIIDALAEALDGHGGIQSVTLQSLSGRVRTYLITFSDGSATTFQVLDGSTITNIQKTSTAGLVDTYTVYMSDGTTTFFQVRNGQDGSATWDQINSKAPIITETVTGAIASFPDGADDIPVADLVVNIEPVQDLSNGDPSPTNICPITGWTGCNVTRTGKNLLPQTNYNTARFTVAADGNVTQNNPSSAPFSWLYSNGIMRATLPAGTYTVTETLTTAVNESSHAVNIYNDSDVRVVAVSGGAKAVGEYSASFTLTKTTNIALVCKLYGGVAKFSIVAGSTAQSYEPYQGTTVNVDWTAEAGTVYGGSLDVTTGVLTVDRALVDIGDLAWSDGDYSNFTSTSLQSTILIVSTSTVPNLTCSVLKTIKFDDRSTETAPRISMNNAGRLDVRGTSYASATAFKTAMTGQKIAYELATPQTYQLTPQQLNTLLGTNNIWADTGNVDIDYRADTKLYIEKLTMPTEDDMVANSAISSGSFFMIGNTLYRATTAIASGATITVGTNATRLSLADALNALNT